MIGVIVHGEVKGRAVARANALQFFIQTQSDALGIERIGFRKDETEQIVGEPVDGIAGAKFLGHGLGRIAESGLRGIECGFRAWFRFDKNKGEGFSRLRARRNSMVRRSLK